MTLNETWKEYMSNMKRHLGCGAYLGTTTGHLGCGAYLGTTTAGTTRSRGLLTYSRYEVTDTSVGRINFDRYFSLQSKQSVEHGHGRLITCFAVPASLAPEKPVLALVLSSPKSYEKLWISILT